MTVNTQSNKTIVLGNGSQTQFAFGFIGVAAAYISVIFTDADGNESVLDQGNGTSQYQIALNDPVQGAIWGVGGTVTYDPQGMPIPTGSSLTIFRTLPLTQAISLQNLISLSTLGNGAETGLDTLEMQLQQVSELFGRAIVAPIVDPDTINLTLPAAAQRANLVLGFDGAGNVIATTAPASGTISSAMQPVVNAATLAAGRDAFGLGNIAVENIGNGLGDNGSGDLQAVSVINQVATNQTIGPTNHTNIYAASGNLVFTLDRANTLFEGFEITVYALTAAITFNPNASDSFFGQATGAALTVPKGCVANIVTDGASSGVWYADVSGVSPIINVQKFTTSGTYTPSAGLLYAIVEAVGAGGGGGGVQGTASFVVGGGGGGGGEYIRSVLSAAQIGSSQSVTIGNGGTGGAGFANGLAGGSTQFGALITAPGGSPGGGGNTGTLAGGGAGGTGGTGQFLIAGGAGSPGMLASIVTVSLSSGKGGDSHLGFGAPPTITASGSGTSGANGQLYGGGGGGGKEDNNTAIAGGGTGGTGLVIVTEFLAFAA